MGIFDKWGVDTQTMPMEAPKWGVDVATGAMPGLAQATMKPKKRGIFGSGIRWQDVLGSVGDALTGNPVYGHSQMQQRQSLMDAERERQKLEMQQQQRMADRDYERQDYLFKQDYERSNPKPAQPTEFERLLGASGLPEAQQAELMRQYVQNRANPIQGVPFTDEQGNSGIQFIRPGQMQQGAPAAPVGNLKPYQGGPAAMPGNFQEWY